MTHTEEKVIEHIKEMFEIKGIQAPQINGDSPIDRSLGLDSLDYAELAVRLEMEFGHDPFASGEVPPLQTVADLAALYDNREHQ